MRWCAICQHTVFGDAQDPGEHVTVPCEVVTRSDGGPGVVVSTDTGEILGLATATPSDVPAEPFRVTDRTTAEWVLRRIFEAESQSASCAAQIKAVTDNLASEMKRHERDAAFFRQAYGAQIEDWARSELPNVKGRTIATAWARIKFRLSPPRVVVSDETLALKWAESHRPEAIHRTEKLLVREATPGLDPEHLPPGFELTEERDSCSIVTGIQVNVKDHD